MRKLNIEVGKTYTATSPTAIWGTIEGQEVSFDEKVILVEVLPKPTEVICDDGEVIPLPKHFHTAEWFHVKNLETGREHWINTLVYTFKERLL